MACEVIVVDAALVNSNVPPDDTLDNPGALITLEHVNDDKVNPVGKSTGSNLFVVALYL